MLLNISWMSLQPSSHHLIMVLFKSFDSWTERELNIKAEFVHAACWDRLSVTELVLFSAVGIDDPDGVLAERPAATAPSKTPFSRRTHSDWGLVFPFHLAASRRKTITSFSRLDTVYTRVSLSVLNTLSPALSTCTDNYYYDYDYDYYYFIWLLWEFTACISSHYLRSYIQISVWLSG